MEHPTHRALGAVFCFLMVTFFATASTQGRFSFLADVSGLPDYAVQDLYVAPVVPEAGEEVSFHATVRNVGTSRGTHRDFARLWVDDRPSNNLAIVGGLPVGSTQSVQWGTTGNPPPMAWTPTPGEHLFRICLHQQTSIDTEAYLTDANAANDCQTLSFTVSGSAESSSSSAAPLPFSSSVSSSAPASSALPDFAVSTFSIAAGPSEGKFSAGVVITNQGADSPAATYAILEYHRAGGTSWESIVPAKDIPLLHGGEMAEVNWRDNGRGITGAYAISAGTYEFRACADAWNLVRESDERNCTTPVTVVFGEAASSASSVSAAFSSSSSSRAAASSSSASFRSVSSSSARNSSASRTSGSLPNLVIRSFRVTPRSFAVGSRWGVRASVMNLGQTFSAETDAVLKIDVNNDSQDILTESVSQVVPSLAARERFDVLWSTAAPAIEWLSVPGTHRVGICVNQRRQAAESNYKDDCAWTLIRVRDASSGPEFRAAGMDTPSR